MLNLLPGPGVDLGPASEGESAEVSRSDGGGHWGSTVYAAVHYPDGPPGIGAASAGTCSGGECPEGIAADHRNGELRYFYLAALAAGGVSLVDCSVFASGLLGVGAMMMGRDGAGR